MVAGQRTTINIGANDSEPKNEELTQWSRVAEALDFTGLDMTVYACHLACLGAWKSDKNPDEQTFSMAMHARMHPAHVGKMHWTMSVVSEELDPATGAPGLRPVTNYESLQLDLLYRVSRRRFGMQDCNPYREWYASHQIA